MPRRVFVHQPIAMARVPLRPFVEQNPPALPELLAEGVFLASRSASSDAHREAPALRAYDIRSRCRTTPHGVFAGVGAAHFGGPEHVELGTNHRMFTQPSPRWLAAAADMLLPEVRVQERVTFTSNNLVIRRGNRLEAERPHPTLREVAHGSVRATFVTLWLLETCRMGVCGADLAERFRAAFPEAARGADRVLPIAGRMASLGLLLTDLLPDDPRDDPLTRLAHRSPDDWPHRQRLIAIRDLLREADTFPPGAAPRLSTLKRAWQEADAVVFVDRPFTADTLADLDVTLPDRIGRHAAQAADVLWRIGQLAPSAEPYHRRFLERYGRHRMVPLLDVIDPAIGIGPPSDEDAIGALKDLDIPRARVLARLLAESAGNTVVDIDDELVDQLDHGDRTQLPRSAEIHVRVHRERGRLAIAVLPNGGSQVAGSAAGRFVRWEAALRPKLQRPAGAAIVEIVCRPLSAGADGLAVDSGSADHRIALGIPPRPGDLAPDDLLLVSDGTKLTVRSRSLDQPVVPVLFSRLDPDLLPVAARTLNILGHTGERPLHTWSWGTAGLAPFTPRVRYRDITLAPARWLLPQTLIDHAATPATWEKALHAWRSDTHPAPPDTVIVEEQDRHLPLDLRDATDREILRRRVLKGAAGVFEPLGDPMVTGQDGDHVLDLVVLLNATIPAARRVVPDPRTHEGTDAALFLPGSEWLSIHLPVPTHAQDDVLHELGAVAAEIAPDTRLFWLRYQTPSLGPHLRIRFHDDPAALATALPRISTWCADLHARKLAGRVTLQPYERETERYGGPGAIEAAEAVFAADSALVLTDLKHDPDERVLLAAHHCSTIACLVAVRPADALRGGTLDTAGRALRDRLRARTPANTPTDTGRWEATLTAYAAAVPRDHADACASDLIHMHCNRMFGHTHESIVRTLARDLIHRSIRLARCG